MNKKILIVDDSWIARLKIGQILRSAGYAVVEAQSGKEAFPIMAEGGVELVLLDLLMPEMDGLDILKKIKQENISIPVVIVTADIQDTTRRECLQAGALSVVNKPPNRDTLLHEVNRILVV